MVSLVGEADQRARGAESLEAGLRAAATAAAPAARPAAHHLDVRPGTPSAEEPAGRTLGRQPRGQSPLGIGLGAARRRSSPRAPAPSPRRPGVPRLVDRRRPRRRSRRRRRDRPARGPSVLASDPACYDGRHDAGLPPRPRPSHAVPGLVHGFERRDGARAARRRATSAAGAWPRRWRQRGRLLLLKQVHGAAVVQRALGGHARGRRVAGDRARPAPRHRDRRLPAGAGRGPGAARGGRGPRRLARHRAGVAAPRPCRRSSPRARGRRTCVAALGPAIGAVLLRGGRRAARRLRRRRAPRFFRPGPRGQPHLDVRAANVRQLVAAGLRAPSRINHVDECTGCRPDLYHSYRRDGPGGGRMINFVGLVGRRASRHSSFEARRSRASLARRSASRFCSRRTCASARLLEAGQERLRFPVQRQHVGVLHPVARRSSAARPARSRRRRAPARAPRRARSAARGAAPGTRPRCWWPGRGSRRGRPPSSPSAARHVHAEAGLAGVAAAGAVDVDVEERPARRSRLDDDGRHRAARSTGCGCTTGTARWPSLRFRRPRTSAAAASRGRSGTSRPWPRRRPIPRSCATRS